MHRKRLNALAALQLVALQLFAALAFAAPNVRPHAPGEARASDAAASSGSRASGTPNAQRRRRARRRRAADALLPGVWGGDHIRFEVTEGGATIEYDCAHATVEGKILVDGSGRFSVAGTHYREHGGPVREGEASRGQPVRLNGRVGGSLMTLNVTRAGKALDTYTLTRDREAQLFKCR
jgi:hypothetical protein